MPVAKWGGDEVGVLIRKFNDMEGELAEREEELEKKNKELLQSKKLAAIGTLASGVAHELNNPLNNIYLSAQVLQKEAGESLFSLYERDPRRYHRPVDQGEGHCGRSPGIREGKGAEFQDH